MNLTNSKELAWELFDRINYNLMKINMDYPDLSQEKKIDCLIFLCLEKVFSEYPENIAYKKISHCLKNYYLSGKGVV